MTKYRSNAKNIMLSSLALLVLSACGGGSEEQTTPTPTPTPVATAPVAKVDSAVALNDATVEIDVLANDTAGSGGALTLVSVTAASKGVATIVNNKIRYVPAGNFLGSDSFSYTVASGNLNATAAVNISGHQSLNLKGRVVDSPVADAKVQVQVNGETFTTTADSQGYYTLPVLLTSVAGNEVLRVVAQGAAKNNQGFVTLSSLTDSLNDLLALRKTNQDVGTTELAALRLTQITTARDLLIRQISGKPTITVAQLAEAELSLDVEKLMTTAAAIKLLVDNPSYKLPDGFNTIEDFVLNTAAFQTFIADASQGENSAIEQAKAATLSDPNVLPTVTPTVGSYIYVLDSPSFMSAESGQNITLSNESITVIDNTLAGGEFRSTTKPISFSGSTIEVIDPSLTGYKQSTYLPMVNSWLTDKESLALWQANNCPFQITLDVYMGYKKLAVIEQNAEQLIAELTTFERQTPAPGTPCASLFPQSKTRTYSQIVKFVTKDSLQSAAIEFDLSQSNKWILPEISGAAGENELYTLKDDGTFSSFTGIYEGSALTWSLAADKKTLTLKNANAFGTGEFNQMDLRIIRKLDHGLSVLATFKNEADTQQFSKIKTVLPIAGSGVMNLLTASASKNKIILSSVNSQAREWQGRQRVAGDWFGWVLNADKTARSPEFKCDGERPGSHEPCQGVFSVTSSDISAGVWEVKNNELHIERGTKSRYDSGVCVREKPCNLRVIVPLYEKDGVITGYEYNIDYRNSYLFMPRVMHWTIQDLPSQPSFML